jgi:hypothetical protein
MGLPFIAVRLYIIECDLQVLAPSTQHMPHGFGPIAVQIGKYRIRKVNIVMIAANHRGVISVLKSCIEIFKKRFVYIHLLIRGMPKSWQILLESRSFISLWRGTVEVLLFSGFQ